MLETLNTIPWQQLTHAYGEASDVPKQIRQLASTKKREREEALSELYGNIWHQGTVYEASAPAVPFLLELLAAPKVKDKEGIVQLLSGLAEGNSYLDVHASLILSPEEQSNAETLEQIEKERGWVTATCEAVTQGLPLYLLLLQEGDEKVRASLSSLLFSLAGENRCPEVLPALRARLEIETSPLCIASLLHILSLLAPEDMALAERIEPLLASENLLVSLYAALALLRIQKEKASERAVQILMDTLAEPEKAEKSFETLLWDTDEVEVEIGNVLRYLGEARIEAALPALIAQLGRKSRYASFCIAERLLVLVFPETDEEETPDWKLESLTNSQRLVLEGIAGTKRCWQLGNMDFAMNNFGLPASQDALKAFLAG